jgi:hypothetical protein
VERYSVHPFQLAELTDRSSEWPIWGISNAHLGYFQPGILPVTCCKRKPYILA